MAYVEQNWAAYDEGKTLQENIDAGAVATPERMEHIEQGIAEANTLYQAGTVEAVASDAQPEVEITEDRMINFKIPAGADGKSAYDIAVEEGFDGDKTAWLASLKGEDGVDGLDGKDGKSSNINAATGTAVIAVSDWQPLSDTDGTSVKVDIEDTNITASSFVIMNVITEFVDSKPVRRSAVDIKDGVFSVTANEVPTGDITISYLVISVDADTTTE